METTAAAEREESYSPPPPLQPWEIEPEAFASGALRRIVLGLEYAGEAFGGWQSQPHGRTAQDALERALTKIAGAPVRTHCAGRTDAGVHAAVQVIHFDCAARRELHSWVRGVNVNLPPAIAVRWAVEADHRFHARFSATSRHYRYWLHNVPVRPALHSGRVGWYYRPLDADAMAQAASGLLGWHDFSAFRAAGCQAKTPRRLMHHASVTRHGDYLAFDFHANGFLHHMVRNLVGTLVYVGKGRLQPEDVTQLLAARNRSLATAPTFMADGLYLCGVEYPPLWSLPSDGRIIARPAPPFVP